MMTAEPNKPSIGGANLECLLSCKELRVGNLFALIRIIGSHGFALLETEPLLAYGDDPIVPDKVASAEEMEEFLTYTESHKVSHCIVNFVGWLVDAYTYLSLEVDFGNAGVSVSVCEDVLWGFTEDVSQADFKKLQKFAECCKSVAVEINPVFGYIGSEGPDTQDMRMDFAEKEGRIKYDESLFSEESQRKLFD